MFDDPRKKLEWLNQELLEAEDEYDDWEEDGEEDELGPGYNYAVDFGRTIFDDEEEPDGGMVYVDAPKKKKNRDLRFLLFLELIGILAVIGWWLRWLI